MIGYLLDMDGVIYRGGQLIDGADRFIEDLRSRDVPFMFLTNNSQRTPRDVAHKLQQMGIDVGPDHVFTCADATAQFLADQRPDGTAYVIGEGGLLTALHQHGFAVVDRDPDYVVVGEGRTVTFEMVEKALNMLAGGAKLVATNLDPNCPTNTGVRPGCGAIVAMLETASGTPAFSVGKPSPIMMRASRKVLGLRAAETVMIGDTMETDILGATQMGYHSILTLSGGTAKADLERFSFQPNMIIDSLADLTHQRVLDALFGGEEPDDDPEGRASPGRGSKRFAPEVDLDELDAPREPRRLQTGGLRARARPTSRRGALAG